MWTRQLGVAVKNLTYHIDLTPGLTVRELCNLEYINLAVPWFPHL